MGDCLNGVAVEISRGVNRADIPQVHLGLAILTKVAFYYHPVITTDYSHSGIQVSLKQANGSLLRFVPMTNLAWLTICSTPYKEKQWGVQNTPTLELYDVAQ